MARIRTIKPEFWDSPSTAKAGPWARLLFIAMWNWADDYGRGTANLKELEGFAFPNNNRFTDSSGNTVQFRELVAEVSECFDVLFYEVDSRPYYAILSWDRHQRNERRAKKSRYPEPPVIIEESPNVAEIPSTHAVSPQSSVLGTGEQGNRGTGEQVLESSAPILSDEAEKLLTLLEDRVEANGAKRPKRNKSNMDAMRLLIDKDGRDPNTIWKVITFATADEFWKANILSAATLRKQFDRLLLLSQRAPKADRATSTFMADAARYAEMDKQEAQNLLEGGLNVASW